ncbi:hypothetical protein WMY93_012008 [Mugilogobius chulae]|uniref:Uncharacterized protein n=1 Tax=Mugilogobius chulae TaxID=88201 RepID=A0AAW0P7P1_9GOBI
MSKNWEDYTDESLYTEDFDLMEVLELNTRTETEKNQQVKHLHHELNYVKEENNRLRHQEEKFRFYTSDELRDKLHNQAQQKVLMKEHQPQRPTGPRAGGPEPARLFSSHKSEEQKNTAQEQELKRAEEECHLLERMRSVLEQNQEQKQRKWYRKLLCC